MVTQPIPFVDFSADSRVLYSVVEGIRLSYGHLFNPTFATEVSLIDPLPHQRMAVYGCMLNQPRLRFLLADDAGAGKTIMTGLYIREMLTRRLIKRVLIVPPAGLVGNWEKEMRTLFNLRFKIISGSDCKDENPFGGNGSALAIISLDTLATDRVWSRIKEETVVPYDLVVFDEAHKLSADIEPDSGIRKTDRYKVAESIAGASIEDNHWKMPWSTHHLLLLTATPHMGKDIPYYFLWRLLEPEVLSTIDAFNSYPPEMKRQHFIRRTKEEMVRFDGSKIYPGRISDTLGFELSKGDISEEALYLETTAYIREFYNKAEILNRSAARFAMSIFQRRLASSTLALSRSFSRRLEKLDELIKMLESGRASSESLLRKFPTKIIWDEKTGDEETPQAGMEENQIVEDQIIAAVVSTSLIELKKEREQVKSLFDLSMKVYDKGEESKFEKLRELLSDDRYRKEKFIIFTEYKDTLDFLTDRLEALGFAGKVAEIHGGMDYKEREEQIDFFKKPSDEGGAQYLVATDAAGEGINLQFCWLMVNYDIPWNPARLEQRMGRIHRYGQTHDPVIIINLVSTGTREGRVLATLLRKLESIRRQLGRDKVFDVVGRLFEGVNIREYMEEVALKGEDNVSNKLEGYLTEEQVEAIEARERVLFGEGGDVAKQLTVEKEKVNLEEYRRLLPGYVMRFIKTAAPLLGIDLVGDVEGSFSMRPLVSGAMDEISPMLSLYSEEMRDHFTFYRPKANEKLIFLRPGEPVFDRMFDLVLKRFSKEALRGSVFVDPQTINPYFVHMADISIIKRNDNSNLDEVVEERLVAFKADSKKISEYPVEQLLLLRGGNGVPPSALGFVATVQMALEGVQEKAHEFGNSLVEMHKKKLIESLPEKISLLRKGFDYQDAELARQRSQLSNKVAARQMGAAGELARIRDRQRTLIDRRETQTAILQKEPNLFEYKLYFVAHALVIPSSDPEDSKRYDREVEMIAMRVALGYEESINANVRDVSKSELARQAGLSDFPGFDLLSKRNDGTELCIEVKGRADIGNVELSENEWVMACNHRERYWLYVVFRCASSNPQLLRVRDPFRKLMANPKGGVIIEEDSIFSAAEQ